MNYGVRVACSLDIMGNSNEKHSLSTCSMAALQSIRQQPTGRIVPDELNSWLELHPLDIVTLFFESYLTGPKPGETTPTALSALDETLREIDCYKAGKAAQMDAILNRNSSYLIEGKDEHGSTW